MSRVLIVEDEKAIRDMIRMGLEMSGFDCFEAGSSAAAIAIMHDALPDIILLDWMLPGGSGLELLRRLKTNDVFAAIPVIMLTAKTSEDNKIQGLECGADDYIVKPFAPRELIARMNAVLRRSQKTSLKAEVLSLAGVKIDHLSHRVSLDEQEVSIGPTEYKLLHFFMTHQNRVYSRSQLLDHVWGSNVYVEERTVDVHIRRLRKALQCPENNSDYGHLVQTVRGAGYRFSEAT